MTVNERLNSAVRIEFDRKRPDGGEWLGNDSAVVRYDHCDFLERAGRIVRCPKCNGDVIKEKNVAYANLEVLAWEWDDETDEVRPAEYDTDESAEWEACDGPDIYVCATCKWEGSIDMLVVQEVAS